MATKSTTQSSNKRKSNKSSNKKPSSRKRSPSNTRVNPANTSSASSNQMQNEAIGIVLMTVGVVFLGMLIPALAPQPSADGLRFTLQQSIGVGRWFLPWPLLAIGGLLFLKRLPERWAQRLFGYAVLAIGMWLFIAFFLPTWTGAWGLQLGNVLRRLSVLGLLISIFIISLGVDMLVDVVPTLTARRVGQRLRWGFGQGFKGLWQWRSKQKRAANYGADKALVQQQLRVLDKDVKTLGLVHDSAEEQAHLQNWHNTIAQLRDRLHLTKAHHSDAEEMLENGIATARDWRDAVDGFTQESAQLLAERISEEGIGDFDSGINHLGQRVAGDVAQLHPVGKALEKKRQSTARELGTIKKQYHQLLDARDTNISQLRKADASILAKVYQQYQQRLGKYETLTERCADVAQSVEKVEAWRAYSADLQALESRHAGEPFDALVRDQAKLLSQGLDKLSAQQARAEVDALLEQLNIPEPATARPFAQTDNHSNTYGNTYSDTPTEAASEHYGYARVHPATHAEPALYTDNPSAPLHLLDDDGAPAGAYVTEASHARQSFAEADSALSSTPSTETPAFVDEVERDRQALAETEALEHVEGLAQAELEQAIIEEMVHDSNINTDTLPTSESLLEGQVTFKPKLSLASSIPKPSKPSFPSTDWQRPAEPVRFDDLNPEQPIDAVPNSYVESFQRPVSQNIQAKTVVAHAYATAKNTVTSALQDATDEGAPVGYEARFPSQPSATQQQLDFDSERISKKWQEQALPEKGEETISFATAPVVNAELDLPSIGILQPKRLPSPDMSVDDRHVLERTSIINRTIQSFKLNGQVKKSVRGPTVSRFEIEPAEGEKISRYANLSDDIALAMGVESVRVEAPIQGKKNIIGLEVPNEKRDLVSFREAIEDEAFAGASGKKLPVVLGRSIDGEMRIEDLGKMPHLLIAGSTGSGKSVAVNVLISSLLYRYTPEKLRFLMIDPKMVELTPYDAVPHLLRPVVTNPNDAAGVLLGAVAHMERRYKMMSKIGAKSLEQYNAKAKELEMPEMPYIVIIIDELADLMITSPKEVESAIMRLAQMARATGMHLILATQRPSVDILTSLIKVNIPARIAFAVSSSHDSRTILDAMGAERLTGQGDMLFYKPGLVKSIRLQGPFVSEAEVAAIAEHWGNQTPFFEDEFVEAYGGDFDPMPDGDSDVSLVDWNDDKLRDAAEMVVAEGQASVSRLQRRLQVGHARAGKLMDSLEALAIVGPHQGSKPREVLVVMADLPNILGRG